MGDTPTPCNCAYCRPSSTWRRKNCTLVMPFPVELLRFFDRAAGDISDISDISGAAATTAPRRGTVINGVPLTADSRVASADAANEQPSRFGA
jgi:hypothetical protein